VVRKLAAAAALVLAIVLGVSAVDRNTNAWFSTHVIYVGNKPKVAPRHRAHYPVLVGQVALTPGQLSRLGGKPMPEYPTPPSCHEQRFGVELRTVCE
jgi:hypothetical protein